MPFPSEPDDGTWLVVDTRRFGPQVWCRDDKTAQALLDPAGRWFRMDDYRHNATWHALVVFAKAIYTLTPMEL